MKSKFKFTAESLFLYIITGIAFLPLYLALLSFLAWRRWFGLRGLINPSLNMQNNAKLNKTIPKSIQLQFKMLILLRGLFYKDDLFEGWMNKLNKDFLNYANKVDLPIQEPQKIDTLDWNTLDKDKFYQNYIINSKPVVIKNFPIQKDLWTIESLVDKCGDYPVVVNDLDSRLYVESSIKKMVEENKNGKRFYLRNCSTIFDQNGDLLKSLRLDLVENLSKRKFEFAQLFVGTVTKSGTPLHCANNLNFFYQLKGNKRWAFADPDYSFLVRPSLSPYMVYSSGFIHEDLSFFKYCPRYEAIIEEGDLLFNPPWWWHFVEGLTEETVSVSCRIGEGALCSFVKNTEGKWDLIDTNHLFTSLQALNVHLAKEIYGLTFVRISEKFNLKRTNPFQIAEKVSLINDHVKRLLKKVDGK